MSAWCYWKRTKYTGVVEGFCNTQCRATVGLGLGLGLGFRLGRRAAVGVTQSVCEALV